MKKYFIDTNIFLRVLIKEDKKTFRSCYQFLQAVKTNKVKASTASIVIAETAWTLRSYYKFPKTKVVQAIRGILSLRGLRIIDSYDSLWAIEKFSRYNVCLLYTSPSPRDLSTSRMPSSA